MNEVVLSVVVVLFLILVLLFDIVTTETKCEGHDDDDPADQVGSRLQGNILPNLVSGASAVGDILPSMILVSKPTPHSRERLAFSTSSHNTSGSLLDGTIKLKNDHLPKCIDYMQFLKMAISVTSGPAEASGFLLGVTRCHVYSGRQALPPLSKHQSTRE